MKVAGHYSNHQGIVVGLHHGEDRLVVEGMVASGGVSGLALLGSGDSLRGLA